MNDNYIQQLYFTLVYILQDYLLFNQVFIIPLNFSPNRLLLNYILSVRNQRFFVSHVILLFTSVIAVRCFSSKFSIWSSVPYYPLYYAVDCHRLYTKQLYPLSALVISFDFDNFHLAWRPRMLQTYSPQFVFLFLFCLCNYLCQFVCTFLSLTVTSCDIVTSVNCYFA